MNGHGAVVLVADDSLVVRTLLRRQLEEQGHSVIEAVDGEDAVRQVREQHPDIVLLDVEMPNLDGHGVLRRLQDDPEHADIPVVFLTARTTTEDVVEGLRLGAHDYLCKPFEPAELVARVSAAIRVKTLQDELRQRNNELAAMSNTDSLTTLPNRRFLQQHLVTTSSLAARDGSSIAVLMIDVDHFKRVNDTLGHNIGDVVLKELGARLASTCKAGEIAGRWGGEEFMVIASPCESDAGIELAERLRTRVAGEPVAVPDGGSLDITVSIGVAAGHDIEVLLRTADENLYTAKERGRDRVVG